MLAPKIAIFKQLIAKCLQFNTQATKLYYDLSKTPIYMYQSTGSRFTNMLWRSQWIGFSGCF
jgi:hypothetical protein